MESISTYFVKKFLDRNIIAYDKSEICKIGLELIIADIINFSAILLIGAFTKSFIQSCIYLIVFWTVRRFCGGFHAKTYMVCRICTIGTFVLVLTINNIISSHFILYAICCNITAILTMLLLAPIRHPNKDLTDKEVKANKLFSLTATCFFSAISVVLTVCNRKEGLIIALTLFAITALMYVGLIVNRKEGNGNVQIQR